jgi:HSP20 family protein
MRSRIGVTSISRRLSENARREHADAASKSGTTQDSPAGDFATDLFGRLRHMMEQLTEAAARAQESSARDHRSGTIDAGGREARVVFGYKVSNGLDGLRAEPFGDVPQRQRPADDGRAAKAKQPEPASRAPIVDVFEDATTITVVAELPGVADEDVSCAIAGLELSIKTKGLHRYTKTLTLPGPVNAESLEQSCRNGILEVRLARASRS